MLPSFLRTKLASYFIFHVVAEEQTELGKHFGSVHAWDTDKFEEAKWEPGVDDIPVIQGCKAVMECRKV
jgi:flavin reductase (DIM6/NTAB) family NADH-FMN oxidoreductase RutF